MRAIRLVLIIALQMHVVERFRRVEEGNPTHHIPPAGVLAVELLEEVTVAPIGGNGRIGIRWAVATEVPWISKGGYIYEEAEGSQLGRRSQLEWGSERAWVARPTLHPPHLGGMSETRSRRNILRS